MIEIDPKTGKFKLSRKVLMEKPADYVERPQRERRPRPEGDQQRGERRNNHDNNRGERRPRPERNDKPNKFEE